MSQEKHHPQLKPRANQPKISYIVPIFNEAENIEAFIQELNQFNQQNDNNFEIVIVNDGSIDNSLELIKNVIHQLPTTKLISFSRNFGKEYAITAGLEHCQGDVAIIMDADFQQPFDLIPEFLSQWQQGYDMVYAIQKSRKSESFIKRFLTHSFYKIIDWLSKTKIPPHASDFRLLDRKVIDAINQCKEYNRFMKGLYSWVGFHSAPIYYQAQQRLKGKSRFSLKHLFELAITGIISFSEKPLRFSAIIGLCISTLSLVYAAYIFFKTLTTGSDLPGFTTLAVAIMFLGGVQLLSIGLLGEYIGRIFNEVKNRPKYIIDFKIGFDKK